MSQTEVLNLMTGLVNIKHFTKFYLNSIKYVVKFDHHLTKGEFHGQKRVEYLIYVNNLLVYQQSPDNYDLTRLKKNIKTIKDVKIIDEMVNNGTREEEDEDDEDEDDEEDDDEDDDDEEDDDEDEDEDDVDKTESTQKISDTPCTFRLWRVIDGLPLIINGEIIRGCHLTTVHYNKTILDIDGEAGDKELGSHLLLEIDGCGDPKLEAECAEKTLSMLYVFDHSTKTLVHREVLDELQWELENGENDDEDDDENERKQFWESEKETTEIDGIMYYIVDDKLYDVVTEEFVGTCE